jgi:uncharacterized membrane protein YphA (DoxX/SURF4 family)
MQTNAPPATILIRIVVGGIFLSEGIQKFLDPTTLGAGRFAKIGIPAPEVMGPVVGGMEVVGGVLLLIGLLTRFACVPLLVSMVVAIVSTKGPVLVGHAFGGFSLQKLDKYGLLSFLHEARTDLLMLFCLAFLLAAGAGKWSVDARTGMRTPHI